MKLLGFFLVCLAVNQINGFADRRCGAQLTQIMWIICEEGFNTMPVAKRTVQSNSLLPAIEGDVPLPYNYNSLSNIFQIEQGNLLGKNRRTRMLGIVDECCHKSCTYHELAAYCLS